MPLVLLEFGVHVGGREQPAVPSAVLHHSTACARRQPLPSSAAFRRRPPASFRSRSAAFRLQRLGFRGVQRHRCSLPRSVDCEGRGVVGQGSGYGGAGVPGLREQFASVRPASYQCRPILVVMGSFHFGVFPCLVGRFSWSMRTRLDTAVSVGSYGGFASLLSPCVPDLSSRERGQQLLHELDRRLCSTS